MPVRDIIAVADATELNKVIPIPLPGVAGMAYQRDIDALKVMDPDGVPGTFLTIPIGTATLAVAGVAAGYKLARGVHTQVGATDTIVTGLATVVAVVVNFSSPPTVKQFMVSASIGDQAGAPAAGSFLQKTFKPTNNTNDVTPVAATDFTDNLAFAWIAIGT